jgi:hypothetical protein
VLSLGLTQGIEEGYLEIQATWETGSILRLSLHLVGEVTHRDAPIVAIAQVWPAEILVNKFGLFVHLINYYKHLSITVLDVPRLHCRSRLFPRFILPGVRTSFRLALFCLQRHLWRLHCILLNQGGLMSDLMDRVEDVLLL